jgi:acetyl esterase/lipase
MRLPPAPSIRYGDERSQVGNFHLPAGDGAPWPCVALLHGGFWRSGWDRTLMTPLAHSLARRGVAVWNVDYRGTGVDGGGWPATLEDVAAALDQLARMEHVDTARVATCGHSAGGHLALWLAARTRLPTGAPGADARVAPVAAVALAGVADLVAAARDRLGDGAAQALLGGEPDSYPERYAAASPAELLPLGVPQLLVHGARDEIVPLTQSTDHAARALAAGDVVDLVTLPNDDHFDVIEPGGAAWKAVTSWLETLFAAHAVAPDRISKTA